MDVSRETLAQRFAQLDDEVLRQRHASGDMTAEAQAVAADELRCRGLPVDVATGTADHHEPTGSVAIDAEHLGDVVCLTRMHQLMEARVLCARLEAEGIHAVAGDAELIRANSFLTQALGGIRVMVHEANLARAAEILAALKRGDYALDEDADLDDHAASARD